MEYKGQISLKNYISAQWLHLRPRPLLRYIGIIVSIFLGFGLACRIINVINGEKPELHFWIIWGVFLSLVVWFFVIRPLRWKKHYKQQKLLKEPFEFTFLEDGIKAKSKTGEGYLEWDTFLKWKEGKHLILLYQSDILMNILPKRDFKSKEEIDQFRSLLIKKIGKPIR